MACPPGRLDTVAWVLTRVFLCDWCFRPALAPALFPAFYTCPEAAALAPCQASSNWEGTNDYTTSETQIPQTQEQDRAAPQVGP